MRLTIKEDKGPSLYKDNEIYMIDGCPYRIISRKKGIDINDSLDYILYLMRIDIGKFVIRKMKLKDILLKASKGEVVKCINTAPSFYPALEPGDKAKADYRYNSIKDFLKSLYPNYDLLQARGYTKIEIDELTEKLHLSPQSTRRLVLRFLQMGCDYIAVVDQRLLRPYTFSCDYTKGNIRGRKNKAGKSSAVLNNETLFMQFEDAFNEYRKAINKYDYKTKSRHKPSLRGFYNYMIIKYYSDADDGGNITLPPEENYPSYERFYRWVRKEKYHNGKIRDYAIGPDEKRNNNRLLVGNSNYGVLYPAQLVEIDENEVSLVLVSANPGTPNQVVGKPVIYLGIDVLTYCIIGYHVHIHVNNSYEGFLNLMDSMMMTDEENKVMNGVSVKKRVFPGHVCPCEIRVDQGSEYVSNSLKENLTGGATSFTLEGVPITVNIVAKGTGSRKGIVERFFEELNRRIQDALKSGRGYVNDTHGNKHYKEAVLTIEEFRKIVYEVIAFHNNEPIIEYPVTPELFKNVPNRTPLCLWDYYYEQYGAGFDISDERIRAAVRYGLMKKDRKFLISRKQISYRDFLYYNIEDDDELRAHAVQLKSSSEIIDVRYDPRDINIIYRLGKDGIVHAYQLEMRHSNMEGFIGMNWKAADSFIKEEKSRQNELRKKKDRDRILLQGKLFDMVEESKQLHENKTPNVIKDIREAGEVERAALTEHDNHHRNEIFKNTRKTVDNDHLALENEHVAVDIDPDQIKEEDIAMDYTVDEDKIFEDYLKVLKESGAIY